MKYFPVISQGDRRRLRNTSIRIGKHQTEFETEIAKCEIGKQPTLRGRQVFCESLSKCVSTFLNNLCSPAVVRGYSDARKLFFAGCLTYKSSWTSLCSLAILLIPILCLKNSEYRLSGKLRFLNSYFVAIKFVFFKFIFSELFLISD